MSGMESWTTQMFIKVHDISFSAYNTGIKKEKKSRRKETKLAGGIKSHPACAHLAKQLNM